MTCLQGENPIIPHGHKVWAISSIFKERVFIDAFKTMGPSYNQIILEKFETDQGNKVIQKLITFCCSKTE